MAIKQAGKDEVFMERLRNELFFYLRVFGITVDALFGLFLVLVRANGPGSVAAFRALATELAAVRGTIQGCGASIARDQGSRDP